MKLEPTEANVVEITQEALKAFAREQNLDFDAAGILKMSDFSRVNNTVNQELAGHGKLTLFDDNE